jgi:hypothetical protein
MPYSLVVPEKVPPFPLAGQFRPAHVRDLNWLDDNAPGQVSGKVLVTTGDRAYRRPDGVAVVPLVLLGR